MPYSNRTKARFWARVTVCEHGESCQECCWLWGNGRGGRRYGKFHLWLEGGRQIYTSAHRFSWEIARGEFISNDLWCLHKCDNPPCCNPAHLWLGTRQDNTDDRRRKGRSAKGGRHGSYTRPDSVARGEQLHWAKLTEAQVMEIRALASTGKYYQGDLAKRYGVTDGAIRAIVKGKNWKHITGPPWKRRGGAGENNSRAKLTVDQVREIRERYASGQKSYASLAQTYGVSESTIKHIVQKRTWRHIT